MRPGVKQNGLVRDFWTEFRICVTDSEESGRNHSKHNKSNKVLMLLAPHFSIGPQIIPAIRDAPCRKTGC